MKTDVIHVKNTGEGYEEALNQAEAVAAYKKLSHKDSIRLRLLAEEMLGMFHTIAHREADFWIEDDGSRNFQLHLAAETHMTQGKRKALLGVSTSGENAAAKGVMGKLRDMFAKALEPDDDFLPSYFIGGWYTNDIAEASLLSMRAMEVEMWSMSRYKASLDARKEESEWDELEKSIVANLADDVRISIRGEKVEMVILKSFA